MEDEHVEYLDKLKRDIENFVNKQIKKNNPKCSDKMVGTFYVREKVEIKEVKQWDAIST